MTVYFDSSVVLRLVLQEPRSREKWATDAAISSAILKVECFRAVDRLRFAPKYSTEKTARASRALQQLIEAIDLFDVTPTVLERAAQPLGDPLRTLDAIYLATALLGANRTGPLTFATHDRLLGAAASSYGFHIPGLERAGN